MKSWVLKNNRLLIIILIIIFLVKLPFIFHGRWNKDLLIPYMTDETLYANPLFSLALSDKVDLNGLVLSYLPAFYNLLAPVIILSVTIFSVFNQNVSLAQVQQMVIFVSRILVLIISVIGSYFWIKLLQNIIKSRFYQIILLLLINFNILFFLYSELIKTDVVVWAFGSASLYFGYRYWQKTSLKNYILFFLTSVLPVMFAYYGYIYYLTFLIVSLLTFFRKGAVEKKLWIFFLSTFILTPLVWGMVNFQIFTELGWQSITRRLIVEVTRQGLAKIPILEGANNYPSILFYHDYLAGNAKILPFLVIVSLILYLYTCRNNYFRLVACVFLLFFGHLSISAYRTDRVFLPSFLFSLTLIVYLFYYLSTRFQKQTVKIIVAILVLVLSGNIIGRTVIMATTMTTVDTRHELYNYINTDIPRRSSIAFLHLTTGGAIATAQQLAGNIREYTIKAINLDDNEKASEELISWQGYFVLSAIDYDILDNFQNTVYYSQQYQAVKQLIAKSVEVVVFDKYDYYSEPFGIRNPANSSYGIHNPPLPFIEQKILPPKRYFIKQVMLRMNLNPRR